MPGQTSKYYYAALDCIRDVQLGIDLDQDLRIWLETKARFQNYRGYLLRKEHL